MRCVSFLCMLLFLWVASCECGDGGCCKECMNSKPCGDSCIPVTNNCTKVGGCACTQAKLEEETGDDEAR